uniref:Uncharacterized protein n=1 Tax=Hyaloperonospora arabidopsidis (strain Emoy2) TaxID=559515 RepID=M4BL87_HYAAE
MSTMWTAVRMNKNQLFTNLSRPMPWRSKRRQKSNLLALNQAALDRTCQCRVDY